MPDIIAVDDPEDPRVAQYRDVRERDLVGRAGHFIAEGEVVLRVLLGPSRHAVVSLLVAEKRMARLATLLGEVPDGAPVYVAGQAVLDSVVGFSIHRGILAIGRRSPEPSADDLLATVGDRAVAVVAIGIGNHDNIGGIFRNAAAFGAQCVVLDAGCSDPLYRKSIRVSVGAALTVPFARLPAGTDPIGLLARHGFEPLALSPAGAVPLAGLRRPPRAGVLLGAEGPGLPPGLLERARTVAIPMASGFDSLNVATTSGIVLHHLAFGGSEREACAVPLR